MGCACWKCGDSDRGCCEPIVPPNDKAKCWRIVLIAVLVLHFIIIIVKGYFLGILAPIIDVAAVAILWVAIARYDYCLLMTYIVLNLVEAFSIVVILGYYLQTDMGSNVPNSDGDSQGESGNDKGKGGLIPDDTSPSEYTKLTNQTVQFTNQTLPGSVGEQSMSSMMHSSALGNRHHHGHSKIVVFRNLFDDFLKMRYHFYAEIMNGDFARKPSDHANIGLQMSPDDQDDDVNVMVAARAEDAKTRRLSKHGSEFLITFCICLILFYIIA